MKIYAPDSIRKQYVTFDEKVKFIKENKSKLNIPNLTDDLIDWTSKLENDDYLYMIDIWYNHLKNER